MSLRSLALVLLLPAAAAATPMPGYTWFPAGEAYFLAPFRQAVNFPAGGNTRTAQTWGFGYRALGDGEGVNRTGGLQFERVTVGNKYLRAQGAVTVWEAPIGAEYISARYKDTRLRFTAAGLADIGLCDNTFFIAPMLTAGLLLQDREGTSLPHGWTLTLYYRFNDAKLDNVKGEEALLRPALGFRLGYAFPGFWQPK